MSDSSKLAHTIGILAIFLIGIYVGVFIGEANTFYQCEKDQRISISGHFWKHSITFDCKNKATL